MTASGDSTPAVAGGLARHIPVLGRPVLAHLAVRAGGVYIDSTFGAGGYSREILAAANCSVIGIDRDQSAVANGAGLVQSAEGRLTLIEARFSALDRVAERRRTVGGAVSLRTVARYRDVPRRKHRRLDAGEDCGGGPPEVLLESGAVQTACESQSVERAAGENQ